MGTMRLSGKVAAITGAARNGLGRAIALAFAREGADVGVLDIRASDDTVAAVTGLGRRGAGVQADVADPDAHRGGARASRRDPRTDRRAGERGRGARAGSGARVVAGRLGPPLPGEPARVLRDEPVGGEGDGAPRARGAIINIASISGVVATPNQAHYCALKGGVIALTRCMAVELAPLGIRVNAISPGAFETDINRERLQDPVFRASRTDPVPLARVGQPDEVAGAAVLLASDEGSFMVGANVIVDGGQLAL